MSKTRFTTKQLTTAAVIAAVYAALTLLLPVPQYGGVQLRVAEAMTVLPFFFPEAIPGLTVGCFLANLLGSPYMLPWTVTRDGSACRRPTRPSPAACWVRCWCGCCPRCLPCGGTWPLPVWSRSESGKRNMGAGDSGLPRFFNVLGKTSERQREEKGKIFSVFP